jgi:CRISPR/Cas system-associated exonuclease Cas4 (RecB family)
MRITKLSASAIRDYISCPSKLKYRMYVSGEAIKTPQMILGTVVHRVIENYKQWNTVKEGLVLANHYLDQDKSVLPLEQINNMEIALSNYNKEFRYISEQSINLEYEFSFPLKSAGINLIGRMDVIGENYIADWKVTESTPIMLHNDPQFILYDWAFEQHNKKKPDRVMYINLLKKQVMDYFRNDYYFNNLLNVVIPSIVNNKYYYPKGLYEYVRSEKYRICNKCPFKSICWGEFYGMGS